MFFSKIKKFIPDIIKLTIIILCLKFAFYNNAFDWEVLANFIEEDYLLVIISGILCIVGSGFSAYRFFYILNTYYQIKISFIKILRINYEAVAVAYLLPFRLGEGLFIYRIKQEKKNEPIFKIGKILLVDNVFGLIGLFLVSFAFYPLTNPEFIERVPRLKTILFFLFIIFSFCTTLYILLKKKKIFEWIFSMIPYSDGIVKQIRTEGVYKVIFLSFLSQLFKASALGILLANHNIPRLINTIFIIPLGNSVVNIITPSALGVGNIIFEYLLKGIAINSPMIFFNLYFAINLVSAVSVYLILIVQYYFLNGFYRRVEL